MYKRRTSHTSYGYLTEDYVSYPLGQRCNKLLANQANYCKIFKNREKFSESIKNKTIYCYFSKERHFLHCHDNPIKFTIKNILLNCRYQISTKCMMVSISLMPQNDVITQCFAKNVISIGILNIHR